jgi:hypothetical protein
MSAGWAIGSGTSLLAYKSQLKSLATKTTLAFSSGFDFCYSQLGFYPTYWTWVDPQSAFDGLKHLLSAKQQVPTTILLLDPAVNKDYNVMRQYFGSTSVSFKKYHKLLSKMVEKKICKVKLVPTTTLKHISLNPKLYPNFKGKVLDGEDAKLRFNYSKVVIGMNGFPAPLPQKDHQYIKHMNGLENKLTMSVLPIAHYLKFTKTYIVGFDGKGGRWNNPKNNRGLHHSLPTYKYLSKWKSWKKYTHMDLYSIASDEHTVINKYIPYIDIDKAFKHE